MTNYITKRIQPGYVRYDFKGILAYLVSLPKSLPKTSLDFPGLLLVFVEITPDKVILDHKKSYLVKKWKFSKLTKYDILWSKYDYICHDFYKY